MNTQFKIGGKVVCVKHYPDYVFDKFHVEVGKVKVVRDIFNNPFDGYLMLRFEGEKYPRNDSGMEYGYEASYFCPLQDEEFKQITYTQILQTVPAGAQ